MPEQPSPPTTARDAPAAFRAPPGSPVPRWLVILAWSLGPAAVYALLGLAHAALVERSLTVDVGFGRSLAFWVGALYLALPLWGFLPAHPGGWYARRGILVANLLAGAAGLLICGGYTVIWLFARWRPAVGGPVLASILVLAAVAIATLWFAAREDPLPADRPVPDEQGSERASESEFAEEAPSPRGRGSSR